MKFRPKRRDSAEPAIVEALRAIGCSVVRLDDDRRSGLPDLLVGRHGRTLLLEVKNPESVRSEKRNRSGIGKAPQTALSPSQEVWHRGWRGSRPLVVRTPQEAIAAVLAPVPNLTDVVRAEHEAVRGIPFEEVLARSLANPEVRKHYDARRAEHAASLAPRCRYGALVCTHAQCQPCAATLAPGAP